MGWKATPQSRKGQGLLTTDLVVDLGSHKSWQV